MYLTALGTVTPLNTINVKPQVSGQLLAFYFKEGSRVQKGDVLAEIDPRSFEAQLKQYEGQLLRDQALLENALIDLKRFTILRARGVIADQALETQKWLVKQYEGNIKTDQGLIEGAKVTLGYCRIKSPISGLVGLHLVDVGNSIQTSDNVSLFTLTSIDPVSVIFTLPEDRICDIQDALKQNSTLVVEAYNRQFSKKLATGQLASLDNQIDATTGTLKLKAIFPNPNTTLFANQFVNIKLLITTLKNALVIPKKAVQQGEKGNYIYILKSDNTAHLTPIETSVTLDDNIVVLKGLEINAQVITEGIDKVTEGIKVTYSPSKSKSQKKSSL